MYFKNNGERTIVDLDFAFMTSFVISIHLPLLLLLLLPPPLLSHGGYKDQDRLNFLHLQPEDILLLHLSLHVLHRITVASLVSSAHLPRLSQPW